MMRKHASISRVAAWAVLGALGLTACNDLLEVDRAGVITQDNVTSAAAADALRIGALGSLNTITGSGTAWIYSGLLTDEFKSSAAQQQSPEIDARQTLPNNVFVATIFSDLYTARTRARAAIAALQTYKPTPAWGIAQMWITLGVAELELAEYVCNGAPLSEGQAYGPPVPNAQVFAVANAHLDTALTLLTATDATTIQHRNLATLLKARVLLDLGGAANYTAAAALVASIPTSYAFQLTFQVGTGDNAVWGNNVNGKGVSVGDSIDVVGRIINAVPFGSAGDPRVRTLGSSVGTSNQGLGSDGSTNLVVTNMWGRSDAINLASGLDARLIEAAQYLATAGTPASRTSMMTILNSLRAAPPPISPTYTPAVMATLPVPADSVAAVRLYFREKAFWTFGRGQRLGDLRRMVRQFKFTQDQVFPSGPYFKTGSYTAYGPDVFLVMPSTEATTNPLFASQPQLTLPGGRSTFCSDANP